MFWKEEYERVRGIMSTCWGSETADHLFTQACTLPLFQVMLGTFSLNCFGVPSEGTASKVGGDDCIVVDGQSHDDVGAALFPAASFINHSCGA